MLFLISDLQEYIYEEVEKIDYPSAGFAGQRLSPENPLSGEAGRGIVDFLTFF